jgi:O-antigen/teichoic acid export membrane protein
MRSSIVRRSLLVTPAFIAGHLFYLALMFTANRLLEPASFGRFFAAISLLNVLFIPATALTFTLAQHFSSVFSAGGIGALVSELRVLMRRHLAIGVALVVLTVLALLLVGLLIGATAVLLLLLVPSIALAIYLFEMGRAAMQGMLDFVSYSLAWIACRGGQYILASVAMMAIGTAWSGLAGILVATVIATIVLVGFLEQRASGHRGDVDATNWHAFHVTNTVPFMITYGGFIVINNIDVVIAYFVLGNEQLGAYSASSFLPKAIVTATQPVSQVMLPVINLAGREKRRRRPAFWKALAVCGLLGSAGAALLSAGADLTCDQRFGIRFCSPWLLTMLAFAAIPLGMLRVLVVAGLAVGHQWHFVVTGLALAAFMPVAFVGGRTPQALAAIYAGFAWASVLLYGATLWYDVRTVRRDSISK